MTQGTTLDTRAGEDGVAEPPVSRRLAEFAAGARYDDLPPGVVADAKLAVLDWLGSALAGSLEGPARIAREVASGLGTSEEATVFPEGRSSAAGAALANGVASHILEYDDVHKGSTLHGAAPIIPAALAVAERERADGRAFLLATVLGYEAALRVGEAVNPSHYRYWHPTGTAATFGAAVAAGSLLRLDAGRMNDALGSAGTQAGGLWEFNADGAMSKHLHPGKAAFNGVLAADLARLGFTGATRILEGERGFFRATSTAHDSGWITDGLGERWKISENCYKLHSCCGHTHTAIDTALDLRARGGWADGAAARAVEGVRIALYGPGYEIVREPLPRTPYQAKFSIAYCVAVALLEGRAGLDQFAPERFGPDGPTDPAIRDLLARTRVEVDPALTALYPERWPARLALRLAGGESVEGGADYPRGNPENPVPPAHLEAKFRDLVAPRYDGELAERATAAVRGLDACPDVSALFKDLGLDGIGVVR
ncbi:MAG: MmgE/PrpD family protein [Chloroflexota bacterium]|nr:MmgE/PrpD family protein [Chloroflexota bacterium]